MEVRDVGFASALIFCLTSRLCGLEYERAQLMAGRSDVRVTNATKLATRSQIKKAARALFAREGFEAATTRAIAGEAGIAAGTLFNYFPTKEAIAMALVAEAMDKAHRQFRKQPAGESLPEGLFALIACEMRCVRPYRALLRPVLEVALSPLVKSGASPEAESMRLGHLELAQRLIGEKCPGARESSLAMNLYWALYTGVLAFWAGDDSPNQEDTLAVLDHYLKAFAGSLERPFRPDRSPSPSPPEEVRDESHGCPRAGRAVRARGG